MAVKIRLQRHGKKSKPFYHIVVADARAKRDGRFIEKLGTYNPNTNPATIDLNVDSSIKWLQNGAQPTDTARAILSYKGALYKNHLLKGVTKGALSEEQAEEKFKAWLEDKEAKIADKANKLAVDAKSAVDKALAVEKELNETRAKEIAAKNTPEVEEPVTEQVSEETAEEAPAEASAPEEAAPETAENGEEPEDKQEEKPAE